MSEIDPRVRRALDRLEPFRLSRSEREALLSDSAVFTGQDDFRIPVMPQGRGRSSEGGVSFHFKRDIVSRHAVPILNGKPYLPGGGAPRKADKFEAYLRRDDSAEDVAVAQLMYISRPGAEEAISDEEAEPPGGFPSIISNISTVAAQREDYWRTVWDHLTPPTTNYLIARPEACPGFRATLDEQTRLPQKLLTYLLATRAAYLDYQRNLGTQREKFRAGKLKVSAEEAGEFLAAVRQSGPRTQPVLFKSGRGGRHQYQMAIELPHTLPPAPRWRIMNSFCQQLRSLGLMYTAAHHRAGDHGDSRNCHFHVIFHDRPAGLMRVAKDVNARTVEHPEGPPGAETILLWDFDVAIPAGHKKNARRPIYPFAQPKIDFVSQSWRRTKDADSGRGFFKWLRAKYAQIVNAALEKYGETYRYDPRKYIQMGVGWTPTEHLGPKLAALEAQGIATLQGSRNAVLRYQDLEKDLATECRHRIQAATSARKDVERGIAERGAPAGTDAYLRAVAQTREIIEQQQATAEWSLRLLALRREAAESRAYHADAAPYRDHVKRSRRQAAAVNERAERANGYIERLEEALEPTRAGVKEIEDEYAERQKQLEQIDGEIERRLSSALFAANAAVDFASPAADGTEGRIRSSPNSPGKPAKPSGQPANEGAQSMSKSTRSVVEYPNTAPSPASAVVPVAGKPPEGSVIAQSEARRGPSISLPDSHILNEPVVPSERIGLLHADGGIEKPTGDGDAVAKPTMTVSRIDQEGLSLERSGSNSTIDERIPPLDPLRLGSPAHAEIVPPALAAIHDRVKDMERKRIAALLDRIDKDGLWIQAPPPHWIFDKRLSDDDRALLNRWVEEPKVKGRLKAMLATRGRAAAAAAESEEARKHAVAEAKATAGVTAARQANEACERASAEATVAHKAAERRSAVGQPSDNVAALEVRDTPQESHRTEGPIPPEASQTQADQMGERGSAGGNPARWEAEFDRIVEDPGTDLYAMTTESIAIVRASVAGARQTMFASKNDDGICLFSEDARVAESLARADFSLMIALHELALERSGEIPLRGRTIHIPFHPGAGGRGRGAGR